MLNKLKSVKLTACVLTSGHDIKIAHPIGIAEYSKEEIPRYVKSKLIFLKTVSNIIFRTEKILVTVDSQS